MSPRPAAPLVLALALGCQGVPVKQSPAVLVEPTAEERESLAHAVWLATQGAPPTLSKDALTKESTLFLHRPLISDGSLALQGRSLEEPERFRLVKREDRCVLIHDGSLREFELAARCRENDAKPKNPLDVLSR